MACIPSFEFPASDSATPRERLVATLAVEGAPAPAPPSDFSSFYFGLSIFVHDAAASIIYLLNRSLKAYFFLNILVPTWAIFGPILATVFKGEINRDAI